MVFREHSPELNAFARILPRHPVEVLDEGSLAVGDDRVVLGVGRASVPSDRFSGLALIEHQIVKGSDD